MGQKQAYPVLFEDQPIDPIESTDENLDYIKCPDYTLQNIKDLSDEMQKSITWLLIQFKEKQKPLTEEIDGYLPVFKKNRYGCRQKRWMLITTEAIYIVKPYDFSQCFLRVQLKDIQNLGFSLTGQSFGLRTSDNFHVFYSDFAVSALNSIKIMQYFQSEDFLTVVLSKENEELYSIIAKNAEVDEPDLQGFQFLKENYGNPGEYLITSVQAFKMKPFVEKGKLFISSVAIYFQDDRKRKVLKLMMEQVSRLILVDNHIEVIIRTPQEDLWLAYSQSFALLKEISEIVQTEFKKKIYIKYLSEKFAISSLKSS
jgi:hypothetical protein